MHFIGCLGCVIFITFTPSKIKKKPRNRKSYGYEVSSVCMVVRQKLYSRIYGFTSFIPASLMVMRRFL